MKQEIIDKKALLEVKNFAYYTKEDGIYHQFLCKMKQERASRRFNYFCRKVENNPELPVGMESIFRDMAQSNVLDFKDFLDYTNITDCDIEQASTAATEFLSFFEFGDYREKTAHAFGQDLLAAVKSTFGNTEKNRRLLREYRSAGSNNDFLNLTGFEPTKHDVGSVKKVKQK